MRHWFCPKCGSQNAELETKCSRKQAKLRYTLAPEENAGENNNPGNNVPNGHQALVGAAHGAAGMAGVTGMPSLAVGPAGPMEGWAGGAAGAAAAAVAAPPIAIPANGAAAAVPPAALPAPPPTVDRYYWWDDLPDYDIGRWLLLGMAVHTPIDHRVAEAGVKKKAVPGSGGGGSGGGRGGGSGGSGGGVLFSRHASRSAIVTKVRKCGGKRDVSAPLHDRKVDCIVMLLGSDG